MGFPPTAPQFMGILNVTPDSFSDGGRYFEAEAAIERGLALRAEGADWVDVGGESTRPGSDPVDEAEEIRRTQPVVRRLADSSVRVSIDTSKPGVAKAALDAGAQLVNDVSGLRDPAMIDVCAAAGCHVCVMHMLETPRTMQRNPVYGDVVRDVKEYLQHAVTLAEQAGIERSRLWVDPGFGFGKTLEQNLELLRRLREIASLEYPVLVGLSRKSFLGKLTAYSGEAPPATDRLEASLAAQVLAQLNGASIIRTHDVQAARRAASIVAATMATPV